MSSFRSNVLALLIVVSVGGACFVLGRYTGAEAAIAARLQRVERRSERLERALERFEQSNGSSTGPVIAAAFDIPSLREDMRRLLREELEGVVLNGKAKDPVPAASAVNEQGPEVSAEAIAAFDQGQKLVQNARSTRSWNSQQAQQMRGLLPSLSEEQRRTVMDELLSAISRGEVASDGPPL